MMVAEFVARQQSGSPVNGETAALSSSSMPASHGNHGMHHPSSPSGPFMHDGPGMLLSGPGSPGSPGSDSYPPGYDLASHLKRKELFSQRKQREFIPDNKKDDSYWDRRRRNNEAAKRSREKRRYNDMILEQRVVELSKENHILKAQLDAIKDKYGICGETVVSVDQVLATLPTNEQVLSITKRAKIGNGGSQIMYPQSPSPVPTSVIHQPIPLGTPPPTHVHYQVRPTSPRTPNHHEGVFPLSESEGPQFPHYPVHPPYPPFDSGASSSVLNLSRRAPSPYEVSSGSGSGSGDEHCDGAQHQLAEANNSLPLKLRHKSHLGDKDAATALLSLQHIKQEPGPRSSPPWDAEGSSDERDSGISLGNEWVQLRQRGVPTVSEDPEEEGHLKSELARLASEVASLKNMISIGKSTNHTTIPTHATQ